MILATEVDFEIVFFVDMDVEREDSGEKKDMFYLLCPESDKVDKQFVTDFMKNL